MVKAKKKPELKVVFDTNVIHNGSSSYLINLETADLIKTNLSHHDLNITWHLPDTVIKEREFQMVKKGNALLISIQKLETLLGHNLNITEEIIKDRVEGVIKNQMKSNSLSEIKLNTDMVDWPILINKSLERVPPFEDNKSEKGFRDSLILEAFDQLVQSSPKISSSCKLAFVSNDSTLNEAIRERTKENKNIRYINDLTSLKGLINILVSEIEENLINTISNTASELFFVLENEDTIYYKENIRDTITEKFSNELHKLPDSTASSVKTGTWYISSVNFVKKVSQRIWWSSSIEVDMKSFMTIPKTETIRSISSIENPYLGRLSRGLLSNSPSVSDRRSDIAKLFRESATAFESVKYLDGKSRYEIIWSITYTSNNKFLKPVIEEIEFKGNEWNNE